MPATPPASRPAVERVHPPDWLMHLVNPAVRWMLRRGRPPALAARVVLLQFRGRRSGKQYEIPAGHRQIDGRTAVLTNSGWRVNFRGGLDLDVIINGERRPAHGSLTEDPAEVARIYETLLDELGRQQATRELGVRINVDRTPTHDELRAVVEQSGLSVLWLDIGDA